MREAVSTDFQSVNKALGSQLRQWILIIVSDVRCREKELAEFLGYHKSAISRDVQILCDCQFLQKTRQKNSKYLTLTDRIEVRRSGRTVEIVGKADDESHVTLHFTITPKTASDFDRFIEEHAVEVDLDQEAA